MRGAVPAENYANLNVCYIGRSTAIIDFVCVLLAQWLTWLTRAVVT